MKFVVNLLQVGRMKAFLHTDAVRGVPGAECWRRAPGQHLHHSLEPHASGSAVPGAVHGHDGAVLLGHEGVSQNKQFYIF